MSRSIVTQRAHVHVLIKNWTDLNYRTRLNEQAYAPYQTCAIIDDDITIAKPYLSIQLLIHVPRVLGKPWGLLIHVDLRNDHLNLVFPGSRRLFFLHPET